MNRPPAVLLVHGAWHSAAVWGPTQRALTVRGVASMAIDLPGHGLSATLPSSYTSPGQTGFADEPSPVAHVSMQDCATTIGTALQAMSRHYSVTVLAHSAGGGPASLAAERHTDLVTHLVYLAAFCPAGRPRFADYLTSPQAATALGADLHIGDPGRIGAVRINPASRDADYRTSLRAAYYGDLDAAAFDLWPRLLTPDLPVSIPTTAITLSTARWGRIPRTFVRCDHDRAATPAMQDLMIAEADEAFGEHPFTVHTLPTSHSPFASAPDDLAALLQSIVATGHLTDLQRKALP